MIITNLDSRLRGNDKRDCFVAVLLAMTEWLRMTERLDSRLHGNDKRDCFVAVLLAMTEWLRMTGIGKNDGAGGKLICH